MRVRFEGIKDALNKIDGLRERFEQNVDEAVEGRALKMVNDTRTSAPRKTGKLKNSINIITQDTKPMERAYGTNVEYARRQEFEHKSKRGYFRNNITKHRPLLQKDIAKAVKKTFKR